MRCTFAGLKMSMLPQNHLATGRTRQIVVTWIGLVGVGLLLCGDAFIGISIVRFLSAVPVGSSIRPMGLSVLIGILSAGIAGAGMGFGVTCIMFDRHNWRSWVLAAMCMALGAAPFLLTRLLIQWMCAARHLTIAG